MIARIILYAVTGFLYSYAWYRVGRETERGWWHRELRRRLRDERAQAGRWDG